MLSFFLHEHDSERLSCVSGGGGSGDGDGDGSSDSGGGGGGGRETATAVLLHGAGNGSKERLLPLLEEFVARDCRGLALDFSGHGESSGELRELSLQRRFEQAVAVIDATVPAEGPLILVGFSMSGQTVADLAGHYGKRVVALGLCAPAVYGAEAWPVPFGDDGGTSRSSEVESGGGRFSEIIRTPDNWRQAPALGVLRAFAGRAMLAVPGTDTVIPPAVTEAVSEALATTSQFTRFELPDAEHMLGLWFREHAEDRQRFVDLLLTGRGDRGRTHGRGQLYVHD